MQFVPRTKKCKKRVGIWNARCNLQAILHDREVSILSTNKGEEILLEMKESLSSEK